jgi:hypothetical protein
MATPRKIVKKAIPETDRLQFNHALHRACDQLNADREAHVKAHGSWHLDAGKLYFVLVKNKIIDQYSQKALQEAYFDIYPRPSS